MALTFYKTKLASRIFWITFWIAACWPFCVQELSETLYESMVTPMSLVTDALFIFTGVWLMQKREDRLLLGSLLLISIVSMIVNGQNPVMWLNGLRLYLIPVCALSIGRYFLASRARRDWFIPILDRNVLIFLWLQVPAMVYQFILYGASDNGGGTMGWMNSGVTSMMIYMASFYLMIRRWNPALTVWTNLKKNWVLLFLLFPSYLNETKISFVLLVMYFIFIVPMSRAYVKTLLKIAPVAIILVVGAGWLYTALTQTSKAHEADVFSADYISEYVTGDENTWNEIEGYLELTRGIDDLDDFPRGAKFAVLPLLLTDEPQALWIGYGVGQIKGGSEMERSRFAKDFAWYLRGTLMGTMLLTLDLGLAGLAWMIILLIVAFRWWQPSPHRNKQMQWFFGLCALMTLLYGPNFIYINFCTLFFIPVLLSGDWQWTLQADATARINDARQCEDSSEEIKTD